MLALLAIGWLWLDAMRAREAATALGKRLCAAEDLQFLDDTVAIAGLGLGRNGHGHLAIRRTYRFEFSDTGDNRRSGSITMLGAWVEATYLEPHRFEEEPCPAGATVVEIRPLRGSE